MKYVLTDITKTIQDGKKLHRIKAVKSFYIIKKGEFGGWVEKVGNLSQGGKAWIFDNAQVYDGAKVYDNAIVTDEAVVYGKAHVLENALVGGRAIISGESRIKGNANVYMEARVKDDAVVLGDAVVEGCALVEETGVVSGCARISRYSHIRSEQDIFYVVNLFGKTVTFSKSRRGGLEINIGEIDISEMEFENYIKYMSDPDKREVYLTILEVARKCLNQ